MACRSFLILFLNQIVQQPGPKNLHRFVLVFKLRFFILTCHHEPSGQVGQADGRICRIHALPARSCGPIDIDLDFVRIDLELDLFRFR